MADPLKLVTDGCELLDTGGWEPNLGPLVFNHSASYWRVRTTLAAVGESPLNGLFGAISAHWAQTAELEDWLFPGPWTQWKLQVEENGFVLDHR